MAEIIDAIILGVVQGVTEFLPVSSSGHLALTTHLFGIENISLGFFVALHFGTLVAVVLYFWNDWLNLFRLRRDMPVYQKNKKLLPIIAIATVPAALAGMVSVQYFEYAKNAPFVVVGMMVALSLLLFLADIYGKRQRKMESTTFKDALLIGLAQAVAILPGVSRSGATMTTALFLGLDRHSAARFSFLLSAPIIFGASVMEFPVLLKEGITTPIILGTIVSFVTGFYVIKYFLIFIEKVQYKIFFWYSLGLFALLCLAWSVKL